MKDIQNLKRELDLNEEMDKNLLMLRKMVSLKGEKLVVSKIKKIKNLYAGLTKIKRSLSILKEKNGSREGVEPNIIAQNYICPEIWVKVGELECQLKSHVVGPTVSVVEEATIKFKAYVKSA
jgi:hypothetical protein